MAHLSPRELALACAHQCAEKGAEELRVMALPPGAALFDYVVLATARSERQCMAIAEGVHRFCKSERIHHHGIEGEAGWMLVDCLDVVVHVLSREMREHYQLDALWKAARDVDVAQELQRRPTPGRPA